MSIPPDPQPAGTGRMQAVLKYSGLAFQMLVVIGGSAWLGYWLDGRMGTGPWLTIGLLLLGVFIAVFQVIRSLTKESL
ncbi:AtpZ/AtpI family protein [Hymenobacter negativus]|uniref:AtpZ/AtpI family protein n=1 Tax=Hymenobacter negativus TaxID=2795026 RepID=A0ABS3QBK6_9BACT|nr:AtpZ/AtpI family protein [Hymenobacter negativus]MBO2008623.1 AtpZ/AtpI family protein [Hymenobacter negativus]